MLLVMPMFGWICLWGHAGRRTRLETFWNPSLKVPLVGAIIRSPDFQRMNRYAISHQGSLYSES
jgi:hypothetical protein